MLVVSDLEDPYLPQPDDLLCNLSECRSTLESLLNRMNDMFKDTQNVGNALGPALQAAYKLVSPIGGKILCLQASLPNLEAGALKMREDPKLLGSSKESTLLQPASSFYKTFAVDCSKSQVCVDMFLFGSQYSDVATLSKESFSHVAILVALFVCMFSVLTFTFLHMKQAAYQDSQEEVHFSIRRLLQPNLRTLSSLHRNLQILFPRELH